MASSPRMRLLSLGAGVQSTALALMAAHDEFWGDKPDAAIFADTGWEPRAVYEHLETLKPLLPFPVHVVSVGNIKSDILARRNTTGGRFAAIPWFTLTYQTKRIDGVEIPLLGTAKKGMGQRQCTSEYKLTPIMWKIRELLGVGRRGFVRPGTVEQWIGISIDEATRMKPARQKYITNRWPLVERGISRAECLEWLNEHGYTKPPKSACIGCPFHNEQMWQEMKRDNPVEFEEACQVDDALRTGENNRGIKAQEFMHRSCVPLREAVELPLPKKQPNLFENECEGMCGV